MALASCLRQLVLLSVLTAVASSSDNATYLHEESLVNALFKNGYTPTVRPTSPTVIISSIVLFALNKMDTANQEMSVSTCFYMTWHDPRLKWDPALYNNISKVMVPYGTTWLPPIIVENAVDEFNYVGSASKVMTRVYHNGWVKWMPPVVFKVSCPMQILRFPFDTQTCSISFNAWTFDTTELLVEHSSETYLTFFTPNGEWDFLDCWTVSSNLTDGNEIFIKQNVWFKFKRRWLFLGMALLVPAILNSMLMCIVFALPFESGEKMSYSLTVLLSFIVLLSMVQESIPPVSNELSVLQIYLTGVMCTGTVATILTVWTVTMYNKPESVPVPGWIKETCVSFLKPVTCRIGFWDRCVKPCQASDARVGKKKQKIFKETPLRTNKTYQRSASEKELSDDSSTTTIESTGTMSSATVTDTSRITTYVNGDSGATVEHSNFSTLAPKYFAGLQKQFFVEPQRYKFDDLFHSIAEEKEQDVNDKEGELMIFWQDVARLMDALFLRLFSFVIGVGTLSLVVFFVVTY